MENKPNIKEFMREKSSFFRYLKDEELQILEDLARNRKFSNETVMEEERWTPRVYLLYRGYVAVLPQSEEEVKWYLRPGMVLDTGIFMPEKRGLVTKTISDIEFVCWDREAFEQIFKKYPHLKQQFQTRVKLYSDQQQIRALLLKNNYFAHVGTSLIEHLLEISTLCYFSKGEYICRQGDTGKAFFVIARGSVKAFREEEPNKILRMFYAGNAFGEIALVKRIPRIAHVVAQEDCELFIVPEQEFHVLYNRSSSFRGMVNTVCRERGIVIDENDLAKQAEIFFLVNHSSYDLQLLSYQLALAVTESYVYECLVIELSDQDETEYQIGPRVLGRKMSPTKALEFLKSNEVAREFHYIFIHTAAKGTEEFLQKLSPLIANIVYISEKFNLLRPLDKLISGFVYHAVIQTSADSRIPIASKKIAKLYPSQGAYSYQISSRSIGHLARIITNKQVGLALGGGSAWGFGHIALIKTLERLNIPIDMVSGTSFGSVVGACYAQFGAEGLQFLLEKKSEIKTAATLSFVHGKFLELLLDVYFGNDMMEDLPIPFFAAAIDFLSAREKIFKTGKIKKVVRASSSLPGIFSPMWIDNKKYIDGAFLNNVPVNILVEEGADFIISSQVIPPAPKQKQKSSFVPEFMSPVARIKDLLRAIYILLQTSGESQAFEGNFTFNPNLARFDVNGFEEANLIVREAQSQLDLVTDNLYASYKSFCSRG
ncbi:patatin-like phospholipase family protein [Candidatus Uabimicrobium amorphum]|uniref:Alpha/beta hydrolase n=1 Tax=Uabimicrobium amorphum TaxID=2596890 RepID=A0A5S9ITP2_UABAM|nr:patatin-like phospholipase family protein [Candidatus Uabimicrobium amorphum]BBM87370.1 alpha/beta hydrolase [Candidatus Uabimicrobium amorphum]